MTESYNYDFLKNNSFSFALERIPQTAFRVVNFEIPDISIVPPTGGYISSPQYFAGSSVEFSPLTLEFLVDDDLLNYEEIYKWITDQQYNNRKEPVTPQQLVSDGVLITMDKNSNPNRVFEFRGMFPISLGSIRFDTTSNQPESVRCLASFRYSYFVLQPKNLNL